ncbi:hypothetical protein BJV82DRAFT_393720 [Fennellomyces sp. T-0311]|nr:hypothetical protein BJV82DRAFT_393720 [Fennellomyces sp. T-0311]
MRPKCNNELSDYYYSEDEKSVVSSADEENRQMSPERVLENRLSSIRNNLQPDKEAESTILLLKNMFAQIPFVPQSDEFDNPPMLPPKTTNEYMDALSVYVELSNLYGDIPSSTQDKRPNALSKSGLSDDPRITLSVKNLASDQKKYDKKESESDIDRYFAHESQEPSQKPLKGFRPTEFPYRMPLKANHLYMTAHTIEEFEYMSLITVIHKEEGRYFAYRRARSKLFPHDRSAYVWPEESQGVYNFWNGERRPLTPRERTRFLEIAKLWILGILGFNSETKRLFVTKKGVKYIEYLKNPPPPPPPSHPRPPRITTREEQECNVDLNVSIINKSFVVEGRVNGMTRSRFARYIAAYGGIFRASTTKSTSYLVKGYTRVLNHTYQYHKAKEYGVPILNEEQFRTLIKAQGGTLMQKNFARRVRLLMEAEGLEDSD